MKMISDAKVLTTVVHSVLVRVPDDLQDLRISNVSNGVQRFLPSV